MLSTIATAYCQIANCAVARALVAEPSFARRSFSEGGPASPAVAPREGMALEAREIALKPNIRKLKLTAKLFNFDINTYLKDSYE